MQDLKAITNFLCDILVMLVKTIYLTLQDIVCAIIPRKRKSVKGEIVLITGAGHGLGKDLAIAFAELGAVVVLWSTTKSRLDNVANVIRNNGGVAYSYQCDVSDETKVEELARQVQKEVGDLTILINNAGIMPCKPLSKLTNQEIRRTIDVNLLSHFWTIRQFLPKMKAQRRGHIVAVSSIAAHLGANNITDYCASKFGIRGLMLALREELHAENLEDEIKLTMVSPGTFTSGLIKKAKTKYPMLMPIVSTEHVCKKAMDAILKNDEEVIIPKIIQYCIWMKQCIFTSTVGKGAQRFTEYTIES